MDYLMSGVATERMIFRLLNEEDFDTWVGLFRQRGVAKFLGMSEEASPENNCRQWFERTFLRYENRRGGMNVLIDKYTGALVGQCGLLVQTIEGKDELEVGYSILPQFWNKGYASEAAAACRDYAFENKFARRLISIIHEENIASKKVALRNGMRHERSSIFHGMPVDIFSISARRWREHVQESAYRLGC